MKIVEDFDSTVSFYIGQNSRENSNLYKDENIGPDSIWFHLDDYPSCHVYAVNKKDNNWKENRKDNEKKIIKQGAILVKNNTKKKPSGKLYVCYTPKSNLKHLGSGTMEFKKNSKVKILKV